MNIIPYQPGMQPEAGKCYSGMPNDAYHHEHIDWFSSSDLKNALRSVEYFWQEYHRKKNQEEREYKLAFEKGTAYHDAVESLVVHGDLRIFEENTVPFVGKNINKAFHLAKERHPGKTVVPADYFESVPIMAEKTKAAGDSLNIFQNGEVELAFFWEDPQTKLKMKCKTDYTRLDVQTIFDFKSTKDCREREYKKDLANYGYHFSAAMYIEGVLQVTGIEVDIFMHIATNNTAPFEVEFYFLDDLALQEGEFLFRNTLQAIASRETPKHDPKKIALPFWAVTKFDKEYGQ